MEAAAQLIQEIMQTAKNAEGYASGGGGAALRDVGQVSSSSTGNIANNPNRGGAGSNGKIILEWYE